MIGRRAMGGAPASQAAVMVMAALSATSACLAWYNIRFRRRIDLHRRWNIRTAFYVGSAITERIFFNGLAFILATQSEKQYSVSELLGFLPTYSDNLDWQVWTCDELQFLIGNRTDVLQRYPSCIHSTVTPVAASLRTAEGVGTALRIAFGASTWLAIALHAVLAEVYVRQSRRVESL